MYVIILSSSMLFFTLLNGFCSFKSRFVEKIFTIFMISFISILLAVRSLDVPDTRWYEYIFKTIDCSNNYGFSLVNDNYQFGVEYGFLYFIIFIKKYITSNFNIFLWITATLSLSLDLIGFEGIIKYVKQDKKEIHNSSLLITIIVAYYGFYYGGIAIRAGIAIGLLLIALKNALDNCYILAVGIMLLAFSFHKLSLIGIILFLVIKYIPKINYKIFLNLWLVLGVLIITNSSKYFLKFSTVIINWISSKIVALNYAHYLSNLEENTSVFSIALWGIGLVLIFLIYELENCYKLFNSYLVGISMVVLLSSISGASRIYDFFILANVPLMYMAVKSRNKLLSVNSFLLIGFIFINLYKVLTLYSLK